MLERKRGNKIRSVLNRPTHQLLSNLIFEQSESSGFRNELACDWFSARCGVSNEPFEHFKQHFVVLKLGKMYAACLRDACYLCVTYWPQNSLPSAANF